MMGEIHTPLNFIHDFKKYFFLLEINGKNNVKKRKHNKSIIKEGFRPKNFKLNTYTSLLINKSCKILTQQQTATVASY